MKINENQIYNYNEVEDIFKVKIRTLSRYIKNGELKPIKFGNKYRFLGSELLRFIKGTNIDEEKAYHKGFYEGLMTPNEEAPKGYVPKSGGQPK